MIEAEGEEEGSNEAGYFTGVWVQRLFRLGKILHLHHSEPCTHLCSFFFAPHACRWGCEVSRRCLSCFPSPAHLNTREVLLGVRWERNGGVSLLTEAGRCSTQDGGLLYTLELNQEEVCGGLQLFFCQDPEGTNRPYCPRPPAPEDSPTLLMAQVPIPAQPGAVSPCPSPWGAVDLHCCKILIIFFGSLESAYYK